MALGYSETPYERIVAVGWNVGAAVIVEVTAPETKAYDVRSTTPLIVGYDFFGGSEIVEADYLDRYVLQMSSVGNEGTVVTRDELDDVWVWDGFVHGTIGDEEATAIAVADGTATFGYAPNLHLLGQQVQRNPLNPGAPYLMGELVNHTHPDGSSVVYRSGYVALDHGPQFDEDGQPFGDVSYATTDAYYWYRVTTIAGQTAVILRKSYLVNFRRDFVSAAELRDFASMLDSPLAWSIAGYKAGTSFAIADGRMTAIGSPLPVPRYSAAGSAAGAHDGTIRAFNAIGFTT